jgi:hypothetical protein
VPESPVVSPEPLPRSAAGPHAAISRAAVAAPAGAFLP